MNIIIIISLQFYIVETHYNIFHSSCQALFFSRGHNLVLNGHYPVLNELTGAYSYPLPSKTALFFPITQNIILLFLFSSFLCLLGY